MPWYDSEIIGLVIILLMMVTLLFSTMGISVALEDPLYKAYVWVPLLSLLLSCGVMASIAVRMVRRYVKRLSG